MALKEQPDGWQGSLRAAEPTLSRKPSDLTGKRGIVVFSGGSAANSLVDVFNDLREANHCALCYVIPVSDNGGSSSELIRVFGGPGASKQLRLPFVDGTRKRGNGIVDI